METIIMGDNIVVSIYLRINHCPRLANLRQLKAPSGHIPHGLRDSFRAMIHKPARHITLTLPNHFFEEAPTYQSLWL